MKHKHGSNILTSSYNVRIERPFTQETNENSGVELVTVLFVIYLVLGIICFAYIMSEVARSGI